MTLAQFLSTLTTDATVVLKNLADGKFIAELRAAGYESLDDAIEARTVAQWAIESGTRISVLLNETTTVEPTPETPETPSAGE